MQMCVAVYQEMVSTDSLLGSSINNLISCSVVLLSEPLIQVTNDDSELRIVINCNTTYKAGVWLNVTLGTKNLSVNVPCSKDQPSYLRGLTCGHKYNVSVLWYHFGENQYHLHLCALAQNITYTHKHNKCSGNNYKF